MGDTIDHTKSPLKDFALEVASGKVANVISINTTGVNNDIDSAASEYLWSPGNNLILPTEGRIHDIVSTSTDDDGSPTGIGTHTVRIFGVDENYDLAEETIILNGTTNVPTTKLYTFIYRIVALASGSNKTNVGIITAIAQVDGTLTAQIEIGKGKTQAVIYLVPRLKSLYLTHFFVTVDKSIGGTASVELEVVEITNVDSATPSTISRHDEKLNSSNNPAVFHTFTPYKRFNEKSLVFIRITSDTNNVEVSGGFDAYIKDN